MNGSVPLLVARMKGATGAFRPNPAQMRWKGAARFVYIRNKHVIGSDAFHKNNETHHYQ
jgi:hypothetical protein